MVDEISTTKTLTKIKYTTTNIPLKDSHAEMREREREREREGTQQGPEQEGAENLCGAGQRRENSTCRGRGRWSGKVSTVTAQPQACSPGDSGEVPGYPGYPARVHPNF